MQERDIRFKEVVPRYKRFFSAGHLDGLLKHLNGNVVSFGRLWVRAWISMVEDFEDSSLSAFTRENVAEKHKESFSQKVVISGVVPEERIYRTGSMGDEVQHIDGSCVIDRVFLVTGDISNPQVKDISLEILGKSN